MDPNKINDDMFYELVFWSVKEKHITDRQTKGQIDRESVCEVSGIGQGVRVVQVLFLFSSDSSQIIFANLKKKRVTDGRTDGPTNGRTDPLIEMRGRI